MTDERRGSINGPGGPIRTGQQRLMRTWYPTDTSDDDPTYVGAFSNPFPAEEPDRRIVDVDWSTRGQVMVTWLITYTRF